MGKQYRVAVVGATGGSASIRTRSSTSASTGRAPNTRTVRELAVSSHSVSWSLKSSGPAKVRPAMND